MIPHLCPDELVPATVALSYLRVGLGWVGVGRAKLIALRQAICSHKAMLRVREADGSYHVRCGKCGYQTRLMTKVEYPGRVVPVDAKDAR